MAAGCPTTTTSPGVAAAAGVVAARGAMVGPGAATALLLPSPCKPSCWARGEGASIVAGSGPRIPVICSVSTKKRCQGLVLSPAAMDRAVHAKATPNDEMIGKKAPRGHQLPTDRRAGNRPNTHSLTQFPHAAQSMQVYKGQSWFPRGNQFCVDPNPMSLH